MVLHDLSLKSRDERSVAVFTGARGLQRQRPLEGQSHLELIINLHCSYMNMSIIFLQT